MIKSKILLKVLLNRNRYYLDMKIAQTLRVARVERNLTQHQLASVAGVSQVTLSHIENGAVNPQKGTREKIEQVIGPVDWARTYDEGMMNRKAISK